MASARLLRRFSISCKNCSAETAPFIEYDEATATTITVPAKANETADIAKILDSPCFIARMRATVQGTANRTNSESIGFLVNKTAIAYARGADMNKTAFRPPKNANAPIEI